MASVLPQQSTATVSGPTGLSRRRPSGLSSSSVTTANVGVNRQGGQDIECCKHISLTLT